MGVTEQDLHDAWESALSAAEGDLTRAARRAVPMTWLQAGSAYSGARVMLLRPAPVATFRIEHGRVSGAPYRRVVASCGGHTAVVWYSRQKTKLTSAAARTVAVLDCIDALYARRWRRSTYGSLSESEAGVAAAAIEGSIEELRGLLAAR